MEKSANLKMESENPEDTEPVSKVLAQALENIEFLGLEKGLQTRITEGSN